VNAIRDGGSIFPVVAGKNMVEFDQTSRRLQSIYFINGVQLAAPIGSSWRKDVLLQLNVQAKSSLFSLSTPPSDHAPVGSVKFE